MCLPYAKAPRFAKTGALFDRVASANPYGAILGERLLPLEDRVLLLAEAKRKIGEGAVKLNGETVVDPQMVLDVGYEPLKLSLGKKRHGLLTN